MRYKHKKKKKKLTLNSQVLTDLSNFDDDQMLILCLFYSITTVKTRLERLLVPIGCTINDKLTDL